MCTASMIMNDPSGFAEASVEFHFIGSSSPYFNGDGVLVHGPVVSI